MQPSVVVHAHVLLVYPQCKRGPFFFPRGLFRPPAQCETVRKIWLAGLLSVCDLSPDTLRNTRDTVIPENFTGLNMSASCVPLQEKRTNSIQGHCQCCTETRLYSVAAIICSQSKLWGRALSGTCFTGDYQQRRRFLSCSWVCLKRLWAVLLRKTVFMSQYRPLKDDKVQAAAPAAASRDL